MPRTNAIRGVLLAMALLRAGPALAQSNLRHHAFDGVEISK